MTKRAALTLGEVLFVLVLVLIGVSILAFVALNTSSSSKHRLCSSNVRQLGTALVMYAMDHDEAMEPYGNVEKDPRDGHVPKITPQPVLMKGALRLYTDESNWFCPADQLERQHVVYLGIDHQVTSYIIPAFRDANGNPVKIGKLPSSTAIAFDAAGGPESCDPRAWRSGSRAWASNHADGLVNYVLANLSLQRGTAAAVIPKISGEDTRNHTGFRP